MAKIVILILAALLIFIISGTKSYISYFDDIAPLNKQYPTTTPSPTPTNTPTPTSTPTTTPSPTPTITPTPTNTPTPTPLPVVNYEELFETYASHYSVDKDKLKRIAICESKLNPQATNGDYQGLFQFATVTWSVTRLRMGLDIDPDLRTNPEEAIHTAAFKISRGGESAWKNCL